MLATLHDSATDRRPGLSDYAASALVDRYIAVSTIARDAFLRTPRLLRNHVQIIGSGIELDRFHAAPLACDVDRCRNDLQPELRHPLVLSTGRLVDTKGFADLIRAAAILRATFPNVHVAIAGEGPLRPELQDLILRARLEGNVSLLGFRNDVPTLLKLCDVFAFPSHREALPVSLLEAISAGSPIVATDIPITRTIIGAQPFSPQLIPVGDPPALAAAIKAVLLNPDESRRKASTLRSSVICRFDVRRYAMELYEVYLQLKKPPPRGGKT